MKVIVSKRLFAAVAAVGIISAGIPAMTAGNAQAGPVADIGVAALRVVLSCLAIENAFDQCAAQNNCVWSPGNSGQGSQYNACIDAYCYDEWVAWTLSDCAYILY